MDPEKKWKEIKKQLTDARKEIQDKSIDTYNKIDSLKIKDAKKKEKIISDKIDAIIKLSKIHKRNVEGELVRFNHNFDYYKEDRDTKKKFLDEALSTIDAQLFHLETLVSKNVSEASTSQQSQQNWK